MIDEDDMLLTELTLVEMDGDGDALRLYDVVEQDDGEHDRLPTSNIATFYTPMKP